MKTIIVNIATKSVSINNEVCNFIEAGLTNNGSSVETLTEQSEIEEILLDQYESQEIEIIFE